LIIRNYKRPKKKGTKRGREEDEEEEKENIKITSQPPHFFPKCTKNDCGFVK